MNKVKITFAGINSNDSIRGIGVHTKELIDHLRKLPEIEIVSSEYDVIHYTKFSPFFLSLPIIKPQAKVILTIHDLIPLIYPKQYPPGIKGSLIYLLQKILIKNVDAIITISETSKKDICRFLAVQPDKVHVIYLAPKEVFKKITDRKILDSIKEKYNLPDSFALYVGDVNYNKNISGLLEMCKYANIPLVIVGKQAKDIENQNLNHPELKHLQSLDWSNVIRPGFVQDDDLASIYNLADVYIQPSFYEGFSLPVLEARACGTWVIDTRIQTHIEILDTKRDYSWKKTARETLQVYEAITHGDERNPFVALAKKDVENT